METHKFFKALGDKTRYQIVLALLEDKKNCCTDLAEITNKDLSTITRQLEILKNENIIEVTKVGKKKCVSLIDKKQIVKIINEINKKKE